MLFYSNVGANERCPVTFKDFPCMLSLELKKMKKKHAWNDPYQSWLSKMCAFRAPASNPA